MMKSFSDHVVGRGDTKFLVTSWFREEVMGIMFFKGHMVKGKGDEKSFGDHMIGKGVMKIFSD
jgi:hypothetical protein